MPSHEVDEGGSQRSSFHTWHIDSSATVSDFTERFTETHRRPFVAPSIERDLDREFNLYNTTQDPFADLELEDPDRSSDL